MEERAGGAAPVLRDQYEIEKLPPEQQRLLDPAQPIPAGTQFFPQEHRWGAVFLALAGGVALILCGLGAVALAIVTFDSAEVGSRNGSTCLGPLAVAAVIGVGAGIVVLLNARNRYRAIQAQGRGETARIGLFLSPGGLLERGPFTYRYFPRERLLGVRLEGTAPMIVFRNDSGAEQALTLPTNLVGLTTEQTVRVVEAWLLTTQ